MGTIEKGMNNEEINREIAEFFAFEADFAGDLNAMHQAEDRIRVGLDMVNKRLREYRDELAKVVGCGWYQSAPLIVASSEQRARAMANVIKKWKQAADF